MARFSLSRACLAVLASIACLTAPVLADEQKEAADISTRVTDNGARIVFKWNEGKEVPFRPESHGDKVYLHFDSPVNLQWSRTVDGLKPYIREVETRDDSKTVVLTLANPAQARKFYVNGKNGIDFSKNGVELTNTGPLRFRARIDRTCFDHGIAGKGKKGECKNRPAQQKREESQAACRREKG